MKCLAVVRTVLWLTTFLAMAGAHAQEASTPDYGSSQEALQNDFAKNPLNPADTSSPRATLLSFLDNMNRSYRVLMAAHRENEKTPGIRPSKSVKRMAKEAEMLFERGVDCLNLSRVPPSIKKEVAYEAALQLKEVLDRIELPPAQLIPDADTIEKEAAERELPTLFRWRVPNTDIVISRVDDGPRKGEYLFTPQTVAHVGDFYNTVKNLPYKPDVFTSDGFFEFYVSTPGWLLPPKWNQWLPGWSKRMYLSQTIWQWAAFVVSILLWLFFVVGVFRALLSRPAALSHAARFWRRALFSLSTIVALLVVHFVLREEVNITGSVLVIARIVLVPFWWFVAGAMTFFVAMGIAETIIASPKTDPEGIQASYYRVLFGVMGFVGGSVVFIFGLSRIGFSLIPLLTGLGIGGLALALAARPTIEGVISSFTIFADNPCRVGERVSVMGHIGTVESIGLRSTRIRLLNGHVTTIPNERMAASEVENIGRRPFIRRIFNVTITYDTPPEKINRAVNILQEILAVPDATEHRDSGAIAQLPETAAPAGPTGHQPHPNEAINRLGFPPRVYFNDLNADSLNIYVSYWYHPPKYWDYMEHAHWVNLQIMERFNAEGIDFAFPTQTVHLADDRMYRPDTGQGETGGDEAV